METLLDTIWDKLYGKVDDLIVFEYKSNDHQVKFSESQIDVDTFWHNHACDVFVAKDGKTTATRITAGNDEQTKANIASLFKILGKIGPNQLYKGIADGSYNYQTIAKTNDTKFEKFSEQASEIVRQAIDQCEKAGAKRSAGILFFGKSSVSFRSSAGPKGSNKNTYWEFNIRGLQEDTDSTGFGQNSGAIPSEAEKAIAQAGKDAGQFSKLMIGAKMGKPGQYDVIFGPGTGGQVLAALPRMANPFTILFGQSGLGDRMGEQLCPEFVNINDEGPRPDSMVATPFDFEGVATQSTPLIKNGVLINLIHNTSSAKLMQGKGTANSFMQGILSPSNHTLVFSPGTMSFDDLCAMDSDRPTLYTTNSWYLRYTNSIEGIFSVIPRDGLFLVNKKGDMEPVKKLRISDNLYRIMKNIEGVGSDLHAAKWWDEVNPPVVIPHVRVSDCRASAATK